MYINCWNSIGVSAGDSFSTNNMIHSFNRIILDNQNAKQFDILNKIKEKNIIIPPELLYSLRTEGSKWYKNGNDIFLIVVLYLLNVVIKQTI